MVEYGPVEIGGKTYTCPVRSVSIMSRVDLMRMLGVLGEGGPPELTQLNDVTFENYHQFRSESRIVTGDVPATLILSDISHSGVEADMPRTYQVSASAPAIA